MFINKIIKRFSSNSSQLISPISDSVSRITSLLDNTSNIYQRKCDKKFIGLDILDEKFNDKGWYIETNSKKVYKMNLKIEGENIFRIDDGEEVLKMLSSDKKKIQDIFFVDVELSKISRHLLSSFKSTKIFPGDIFSINSHLGREHFVVKKFNERCKKYKFNLAKKKKRKIGRRPRLDSEDLIHDERLKHEINWKEMISASKTRNHILRDPLIDWLKEYNIRCLKDIPKKRSDKRSGSSISYRRENTTLDFILNQGNVFEDLVMKHFMDKYQVEQVADSSLLKVQVFDYEKYLKTVDLMRKGTDLIYQAVLWDLDNKTFGCPDLLIRSDKIKTIFGDELIEPEEELKPASRLDGNFHYRVIDIKKSILHLNSDGLTLRNKDSVPAYKGQIAIYNKAIEYMTGYLPPRAYVLGTKWLCKNKKGLTTGSNCLKKLGVIDYDGRDKDYYQRAKDACEWVRDVRNNGDKWKIYPNPSRPELYPNMTNQRDDGYNSLKKELSEHISEITSIWMCGVAQRENALAQEITSWKDPNCTSTVLFGCSEDKKRKTHQIVDKILEVNRSKKRKVIPDKVKYDIIDWKEKKENEFEFFIDFETLNSNMNNVTIDNPNRDTQLIFLVGLGWQQDGEWDFKYFLAEDKTISSEEELFNQFWKFVDEKVGNKNAKFYHWTHAEPSCYNKLLKRHQSNWPQINFLDLYKVFYQEPIVVKGALSFSLKAVAKALYKQKKIKTCWTDNNPCQNGFYAMILAYQAYDKKKKNNPVFDDIVKYNEVDCKVLWEILTYLRENHI